MAVHRISDRAEAILQELARSTGKKPGEILSQLLVDYYNGLSFDEHDTTHERLAQAFGLPPTE